MTLQLTVRVSVAVGNVDSLLISACWFAWFNDKRCLLVDLRLAVPLDRSLETAEHTDDGLPTSITTNNTSEYEFSDEPTDKSDATTQERSNSK